MALLLVLASCGDSRIPDSSGAEAAPRPATTHLRATLVLEPPQLRIGDVVTARITVVTPPDHRLLPVHPPEVSGAWLLDAATPAVQRSETRWVHRTNIRLRTRDVGALVWPAFEVTVEDAGGAKHAVGVAEREFEVVSMLTDFPDQVTPFGLRTRESTRSGGSFWLGVANGAGVVLALAAAALAFYRARDRLPRESEAARRSRREQEVTLWEWADSELAAANAVLDSSHGHPRDAANRGARLLRQYVARRFNIQTEALTTEELRAAKPPLAIDSRWPELVRILGRFDAERFRPTEVEGSRDQDGVRSELEAVQRFVADSTPLELRR